MKKLIILFFLFYGVINANAQSVAIGEQDFVPNKAAILEIRSTDKGILIPRVADVREILVDSGSIGLLVYQTDNNAGFYFYNGTEWKHIGQGGSGALSQVNADWNSTDGVSQILNKPVLAPVATSGSYKDLVDTPAIIDYGYFADSITNINARHNAEITERSLADSRLYDTILSHTFSGNYSDLSNKPEIPTLPTLATVATSGSYNDLSNKPTIPAAQVNSNWNATSGISQILNKPALAIVATSGSYNDLSNKPDIPTLPTLATVATSGSYNDLSNKPTIPAPQVNSNWNATSGISQILNKPALATVATSGSYNDLSNKPDIPTLPTFADVALSGSYKDLVDTPTIINYGYFADSIANINAKHNAEITERSLADSRLYDTILSHTFSGNYSDLSNKPEIPTLPTLAPVATSGNYNDLTNKPTIPAAQVNADWNATSGKAQILNKPAISPFCYNEEYSSPRPVSNILQLLGEWMTNSPTGPRINRNKYLYTCNFSLRIQNEIMETVFTMHVTSFMLNAQDMTLHFYGIGNVKYLGYNNTIYEIKMSNSVIHVVDISNNLQAYHNYCNSIKKVTLSGFIFQP
ncbi:MAG: hypothetical protein LBR45_00480 [Bacteroidales bacterium]|jgi:hypothetical protein|nr:hypothetical protein [Bacteroidales bacterium]